MQVETLCPDQFKAPMAVGEEIRPVPGFNDSADARLFHGLGRTRQSDEDRSLLVMNLNGLMSSTLAGES